MTNPVEVLKPLFLIDVDGVVNAWPRFPDEDYAYIDSHGLRVAVHEETVKALSVVLRLSNELVWLTAWRERANDEINSYLADQIDGWPEELGVITDGVLSVDFSTDWKIPALLESDPVRMAKWEGREVIWIEDFGFEFGAFGAEYEKEVRATGVTPIDTTAKGYLTILRLEKANIITERASR